MEALADHKAVGVRAVVVTHLGREATRSELEAARRAARLLEQRGQLRVVHVSRLGVEMTSFGIEWTPVWNVCARRPEIRTQHGWPDVVTLREGWQARARQALQA
jgi:hypothetical protein